MNDPLSRGAKPRCHPYMMSEYFRGSGGLKFFSCKKLEGRSQVNQGQNFDMGEVGIKNSQKNLLWTAPQHCRKKGHFEKEGIQSHENKIYGLLSNTDDTVNQHSFYFLTNFYFWFGHANFRCSQLVQKYVIILFFSNDQLRPRKFKILQLAKFQNVSS